MNLSVRSFPHGRIYMQYSAGKSIAGSADRRHDLDALRAFAMLLGIVLHGALSFMPAMWPIRDAQQNELFAWLVGIIHGFRMPVFFVMSGFFTAMLWRRRGLQALLNHRFRRIFLPLLLGVVTLVPAVEWVSRKGLELGPGTHTASPEPSATSDSGSAPDFSGRTLEELNTPDPVTTLTPLSLASVEGATDSVSELLALGVEVDGPNRDGSTPLMLAALGGRAEAAALLLEAGADPSRTGADGSTPLHTAAFFGRFEVVELLLAAGADPSLKNGYGQTVPEVLGADWETTAFIAGMVGQDLDREALETGRAKIAEALASLAGASTEEGSLGEMAPGETGEVSPILKGGQGAGSVWLARLMNQPFFHHLWFLWFLCWFMVFFAVYAWVSDRARVSDRDVNSDSDGGFVRRLVLSPFRLLWWVPITCVPQFWMGRQMPGFGADTSIGLLPIPQVLAFYAIFFFFGALYYDADDFQGRVGRWWWLSLPLGLLLFPIAAGLAMAGAHNVEPGVRAMAVLLQAIYPWIMIFGLMGLFRRLLSVERPALRYLSDASYWLYLAHLPLIMGAQILVRNLQMPALAKFTLICLTVTVILLVIYQIAVRYTWLGRLLNGPRRRPTEAKMPVVDTVIT